MVEMNNQYICLDIKVEELLNYVHSMKEYKWRLVQIGCTTLKETFELNYSFAKDYDFINLKFNIEKGIQIPSITCIYEPAFMYENEIHDLFGIKVNHISVDYNGELYNTAVKAPFKVNDANSGGMKK